MPRTKKEDNKAETDSSEVVEISDAGTAIDVSSDESASVGAQDSADDEEKNADSSFLTSVAESVGAAVGSVAATVAGGLSSAASALSGSGEKATEDKTDNTPHSKRAERIGIVQSDKMTKTVTVRVERQVKHPIYRKYIKRRKNFMAHDEKGAAIGDKVRIVETRPMSAKKRWRVVEIIQKAER